MAKAMNQSEKKSNENCLVGMTCPDCGYFGPFKIHVSESGLAIVSDEGVQEFKGGTETVWNESASCCCMACGHESTVRKFKGKQEPVFNEFQQVVATSYDDGNHQCLSPDDTNDCGDTLLAFLMTELSDNEGCDSAGCAIDRIDSAIRQLTEVRAAFEATQTA